MCSWYLHHTISDRKGLVKWRKYKGKRNSVGTGCRNSGSTMGFEVNVEVPEPIGVSLTKPQSFKSCNQIILQVHALLRTHMLKELESTKHPMKIKIQSISIKLL